jgi:flagella basal body P-ring formation protein FlgA
MGRWRQFAVLLAGSAVATAGIAAPSAADTRALPVPRATIYPGQILSADDMSSRQFRVTSQSVLGIATEAGDIIGKQARRRLLAGKPVPMSALEDPILIKRGSQAIAIYEDSGLSISIQVQALEDGSENDMILVRVSDTGKVLHARVKLDGSLALGGT